MNKYSHPKRNKTEMICWAAHAIFDIFILNRADLEKLTGGVARVALERARLCPRDLLRQEKFARWMITERFVEPNRQIYEFRGYKTSHSLIFEFNFSHKYYHSNSALLLFVIWPVIEFIYRPVCKYYSICFILQCRLGGWLEWLLN